MNPDSLTSLCAAYGMELQFRRPEECKIRFKGNGTFVDLWHGKRGLTVGVYDKPSGSLFFHKFLTPVKLEDILIKLERVHGDNEAC